MATSTIKRQIFSVQNYPIVSGASINTNWLPEGTFTFAVKKGDLFTVSMRSNGTSGAFQCNIKGSVNGNYALNQYNHANAHDGISLAFNAKHDETITVWSYSNAAAVMYGGATVTRGGCKALYHKAFSRFAPSYGRCVA